MITVDLGGRVRVCEGPDDRMEVHALLRVCAGTQTVHTTDRQGSIYAYTIRQGVYYNILKVQSPGRSMNRYVIATVLLDHENRVWTGPPTERKLAHFGDLNAWTRLLEEDLV